MADLSKQDIFISLEKEIKKDVRMKRNVLIISVPGLGISHELREIVKRNDKLSLSYVVENSGILSEFNILDLNFDKDSGVVEQVDYYFKNATSNQKFAVIINTPYFLESSEFNNSFFSSRIYSRYYYRVFDEKETKLFAHSLDSSITAKSIQKLYKLSGGIGRLLKYLILNSVSLTVKLEDLINSENFSSVLESTVSVVAKCREDDLEKIGIMKQGLFQSEIVETYFKMNPKEKRLSIVIEKDLTFSEDGRSLVHKLTKTEKQVLAELISESMISREKIADFKWGEGSYDEYSDQAINKTMQRLANKLREHVIIPIPKVGYKIKTKHE